MKQSKYVALLRGINLGKNKRVAMADLRELLAGCGYTECVTHLQSGNAVFVSKITPIHTLRQDIESAIKRRLKMDIPVVVKSSAEIVDVFENNPFPHATSEGSKLSVNFLDSQPDSELTKSIEAMDFSPDQVFIRNSEVYMWCPEGFGKSKVNAFPWEKRLGVIATNRNWNTVTKLYDLVK